MKPHPSILRALKDGTHPLSFHPIFALYGPELAKKQFEYLSGIVERRGGPWHFGLLNVVTEIQAREFSHLDALEALAVQVTSEVWGVDPNALKPSLEPEESFSPPESPPAPKKTPTPEQWEEINKRITFNLLIHGAAVHALATMHHFAKAPIESLDPKLFSLYDRATIESLFSSWMMDYDFISQMPGAAQVGGEEKVEWKPNGDAQVKARATMFPFLLHELSKGVMEMLAAHQLSQLDEGTLEIVYEYADRNEPAYELMHFFVGPELWRRFLKAVNPRRLAESVTILAVQPPAVVQQVMVDVILDTSKAKVAIEDLLEWS